MPAAGKVLVHLSPSESRQVAEWLRIFPVPLWGVPRSNIPMLPNGIRVEIVRLFESVSSRKRKTDPLTPVEIELFREDAEWFAAKVSGGMMFGGYRRLLPPTVRGFCGKCAVACGRKRGVKRLQRRRLQGAIEEQREADDPRFLRRLRKRQQEEQQYEEFFRAWRERAGGADA